MPDPYERHGRASGWDRWGPNPSRHQQRAAAAADSAAKRPPAKKDPSLCKAAHWKEPHQPKLRIRPYIWRRMPLCQWSISWGRTEPSWSCAHEEICAGCGKTLRTSIGDAECPDFHPITETQRLALEREIAEWQARVTARRARRPVIDGPQGYRKKKV
jgi:hypothetical protein